jgi:prolyl 4-hydroxylase
MFHSFSLEENYTYTGFAKVQTPSSIQDILEDFFVANNKHQNTELWDSTNTYINHWISPTSMLNAMSDDPRILHSLSHEERWKVVNGVQLILEAWTKSSLVLTSIYGVRIYKEGTILAPHVDKLPLVTSAIINIAQDVDEPWPLEVIDHLGVARNITMEPGEMILYEGHSVIHGRPYPLKGKFFANLFVHFEPRGHTLRHSEKQRDMFGVTDDSLYENAKSAHENVKSAYENAKSAYENAFQIEMFNNSGERRQEKKQKKVSKLPHYVHSDNEGRWKQHFEYDVNTKVRGRRTIKMISLVMA